MKTTEATLETVRIRLSALIGAGAELAAGRYISMASHQEFVDGAEFRGWRAGVIAFLKETLAPDSPYLEEFESCCDSPYLSAVARGRAILAAVHEYIDAGPLARVEELVAAEVFNDLIGIACRLIDERRGAAAVTILGAVLEDLLRRLARARRLSFHEHHDGLATLNGKLVEAHVYGADLESRLRQWARTREHAAAGHAPADSEARRMVAFVREFMADYLA